MRSTEKTGIKMLCICLLFGQSVFLAGCGEKPAVEVDADKLPSNEGGFETPAFLDSAYHGETAASVDEAYIDTSAVSEGYVAVSAYSDARLKFQVITDEETYNYDISSEGKPSVFPLQSGNCYYTFRVMKNKYAELCSTGADVWMGDEFQPYLRPSDYVNYSPDSVCVQKANELAAAASDVNGVVANIYDYVCDNIRYDKPKAENIQSGYLPDPDETLTTGKGICFDYASLTAGMLRSQGIPTRVIFGYVSPNDVYHAWNMFWTQETGWITVSFEVSGNEWNRMDLTFSANGSDDSFIGDGGNYTDVYKY